MLKKLKSEFQVNFQEDNTEPTPKERETIQRRQNLSQEEKKFWDQGLLEGK